MSSFKMNNDNPSDHDRDDESDAFTRLCIRSCPDDEGLRPWGCGRWWDSPAIEYMPDPPLQQGQPATIRVTVTNFGTMDATAVILEAVFNLWIDNAAEANQPIGTTVIPLISAGQHVVAEVPWTPPTSESTHACVHARVIDTYSLVTYPARTLSWRAVHNPQVGNKNVTLVKVEGQKSVMLQFKAKNRALVPQKFRAAAVTRNARHQIRDVGFLPPRHTLPALDLRHPLPFVPSLLPVRANAARTRGLARVGDPRTRRRTLLSSMRDAAVARRKWPREQVNQALVSRDFGFDVDDRVAAGDEALRVVALDHNPIERGVPLSSLAELKLQPGQERLMKMV